MKKIGLLSLALMFFITNAALAQDITVDDIIDGYLENTGGKEAWMKLEGLKMTTKVNQGGMEIPVEIVQMKDGRSYQKITFQGQEIMQNVFDGETMWGMNFQSMKAEKATAEATANYKLDINDFPDSFINYKEKGYTAELMGTETIDGAETYKVKLIKEPKTVNGETKDDVVYYFFDTEAYVPLAQESEVKEGPMAGKIQQTTMSDYQEVNGLYFPFSMTQGIKDMQSQPMTLDEIVINPDIDASAFKYPGNE